MFAFVFFFQAEDGIRDLVRSRGLGDVYKRQGARRQCIVLDIDNDGQTSNASGKLDPLILTNLDSVSYTHLTLPTSDLV